MILPEKSNTVDSEEDSICHTKLSVSREDFSTVLENLCANALAYGFINPDRRDYAVRMSITNTIFNNRPMVRLVIDNNGSPLPKGMSAKKMFTWGVGKGTGIGTWQARHIIEHFGGSITFHQNGSDDGFNVGFEILLPLVVE